MSTAELKTERRCQEESRQPAAVDVSPPPARRYLHWKGVLDRSLAALLLIPTLPVIGLLVVLVRWTSRGPGIFRQARVGRNGVTFMMYKIRTMRVDAEAATGAVWTQLGDSRVTGLGRYLRKLHLDELPQLFNVLRGQMSLVGPRPERPEFVEVLADHIPDYYSRLAVRPGVTGLAQINLPPDTDLDSVRRKQALDLEYIRTAGPWLDARMLLCTSLRLFGCSGQCAMRLMRLERVVPPACAQSQVDTATKQAAPRPAYRDTIVLGVGDTQTFDPAQVAQALRAKELQAASTNAHQDAASPATDLPPPPTPERLRQAAIVSGPANRRPLAPREESASPWSVTADPDLSGAFTVDVEDYFHVTAFENDIPRERWDEYPSRVVENTHRILDLLDRHQVHGTFFVLGWVAERFPRLVEAIHAAGHEVGSHGYWHRRIYRQTPDEFREDVQRSRDVLIDIIGQKVTAYRAPCFSIVKESLWALEILAEEGFEADCSIFPIRHDRYGIPGAERAVHRIATAAGLLWEFPAPTRRVAGVNVPASGGGYFRLLPAQLTVRWLKAARRQSGAPFAFYIHPWELDPDQPRLNAGSRTSRARHYLNLSSTEGKLEVLFRRFRFGRVEDVIAQVRPPRQCRFARPGALVDPTSILVAGEPQGDGHSNGHPPFLRVAPCAGCSCNPDCNHNGKSPCRAPVYQLARDLNAKVEQSKG